MQINTREYCVARTHNPLVPGSTPGRPTNKSSTSSAFRYLRSSAKRNSSLQRSAFCSRDRPSFPIVELSRAYELFHRSPFFGIRFLRRLEVDTHVMSLTSTVRTLVLTRVFEAFGLLPLSFGLFARHETAGRSGKLRALEALPAHEACILQRYSERFHSRPPGFSRAFVRTRSIRSWPNPAVEFNMAGRPIGKERKVFFLLARRSKEFEPDRACVTAALRQALRNEDGG